MHHRGRSCDCSRVRQMLSIRNRCARPRDNPCNPGDRGRVRSTTLGISSAFGRPIAAAVSPLPGRAGWVQSGEGPARLEKISRPD
jgi:hypothetical protein